MTTFQEILLAAIKDEKNGDADAQAYAELAKIASERHTKLIKLELIVQDIISSIKEADIEPAVLTKYLGNAGLIVLPKSASREGLRVILEEPIVTKTGRKSSFRVWIGRDLGNLVGEAKKYWIDLKAKGKEYFVNNLNEAGQQYFLTEEGEKYIDGLFS